MTRRDGQLALVRVRGVDVAHWNPRRRTSRWGRPTRTARPVRNFGDLLGPVVVSALAAEFGLPRVARYRRLFAIGSVVHFARPGDVIWGSGVNGKHADRIVPGLDVRCVRGPRSAQLLGAHRVGGDPGLLLGGVRPELLVPPAARYGIAVVPNLNELDRVADHDAVVNPRDRLERILRRLARSRLVVGSSLHGVIVAESLGVSARLVVAAAEPPHKYEDHYLATGRDPSREIAATIEEAIERGGAPPPRWDPRPLLRAFPADLWDARASPDLDAVARRVEAAMHPDPHEKEVRHG